MKEMDRLMQIVETLRAPGGCPWDAEQDHKSLIPGLLEEAYELAEAIENEDSRAMEEELGDVLLQVVFHSVIAREDGDFSISDVLRVLADKLVYRHPHVFGDAEAADSSEVIANWDLLKNGESSKKDRASIADGIPKSLPALFYALKIQSRAQRLGFDWEDTSGVIEKIREETDELEAALARGDQQMMADEIGDLIFSAVNLARKLGVDPETAVHRVNRRFADRFRQIEDEARKRGISVTEMSMEEKERIWQKAK
ncbi:MAG: nucleoside triphosphate pyrophosphohydrolase [Desulfobacteraceae bacterium]|nr:nucleoside triphosphate pyrophosphohydrolase [Desulfobacteraceae bacterium]MCF8094714.1 nucleoside triphosphate pyrophosphohydrolase [Desulfobacteraceae bacterium]